MKVKGKFIQPQMVSKKEEREMFAILDKYFGNVSLEEFRKDLYSKEYVIILYSETDNKIAGFSTQKVFSSLIEDEEVTVVYSGDTIIDQKYWGTRELPIAFWKMTRHIKQKNPQKRIFWMLISKGVRTYRFLPVFCHIFYPSYKYPTPLKYVNFMHDIGKKVFPERYDIETGLIVSSGKHQFLKEKFHPPIKRNNNPHEKFFYEKNPNFINGDELLCITEMEIENIQPYFQKFFLNLK